MAKRISIFRDLSISSTKQSMDEASNKFEKTINVLYKSVFRNHGIEAFKSKMETTRLKQILLGIKDSEEKIEEKIKENKKDILKEKNDLDWKMENSMKNALLICGLVGAGSTILTVWGLSSFPPLAVLGGIMLSFDALITSILGVGHLMKVAGSKLSSSNRTSAILNVLEDKKRSL